MRKYILLTLFFIFVWGKLLAQNTPTFKVAKLKYNGGDWYANQTSLPNLFKFIKENTRMNINLEEDVVEPASAQIYQYPMVYLTGHGNIEFNPTESNNLRNYVLSGGFILMDDNYGMNQFAKREIKKIFPDYELKEIPFSHPVFRQHFVFNNGLPKIHEHDNKPPQAFGIFVDGRLGLMLTFESDLGDGWENREVHNDPEEVRLKALQMGTNIVMYVINN
jgi:hypothetical protein